MIDPASLPSKTATLNGKQYFYIDQPAAIKQKDTVVLVHGWPDSWYGWRHQIPFLSQAGYRVLCVSQVGFGHGTEAPRDTLVPYTIKSVCHDLAQLLEHERVRRAIFWGHDWGGAVVFRMANYFPAKVSAVMSISTPYFAPAKGKYVSLEGQAAALPQFRYQLYLASEAPMRDFATKDALRKFFNALFQPGRGMKLEMSQLAAATDYPKTDMITAEEVEVYVDQYYKQGMETSTNWYRTRKLNYDDEVKDFAKSDGKLPMPVLFIATDLDPVLRPEMSKGMEANIPKLTRASVKTGHWGLVEAKDEVNAIAKEFLMRLHFEKMRHQI